MRDGFKVIDADRHVLEPSDLFAKYLPEKFRSRVDIQGPNQSYRRVDVTRITKMIPSTTAAMIEGSVTARSGDESTMIRS